MIPTSTINMLGDELETVKAQLKFAQADNARLVAANLKLGEQVETWRKRAEVPADSVVFNLPNGQMTALELLNAYKQAQAERNDYRNQLRKLGDDYVSRAAVVKMDFVPNEQQPMPLLRFCFVCQATTEYSEYGCRSCDRRRAEQLNAGALKAGALKANGDG